ncbi:MAG: poly-beta-1,6 N-acetyl-D-glucosamine synthase [Deltaproteobacteria bacterium]|nr:MAG: poly-beta-1,6 N-acetyl-D-glucosamine synthase [Deltaproteobacteria bacterium]
MSYPTPDLLLSLAENFIYFYPLFMSFVWMCGGLLFYFRREFGKNQPPELEEYPFFSVLVPCHNEEEHIRATLEQLTRLDYPHFEIIAIDDGSQDETTYQIHNLCLEHDMIRGIYLTSQQGKATALNTGALACKGDLILTVDADAMIAPDALRWIAWHFVQFPKVGAVTGNPRIINRTSLLAKIQIGEFSTIIGLIKRSQRILGKILTISGVMGAFRRQALIQTGFWSTDMATEDIDVTWKLEKQFWDVRYEPRALCWIYVPESILGLWRQRCRWARGGLEVLLKHRDIWLEIRQWRLWPIYTESLLSLVWAYCFWGLALMTLLRLALPFPWAEAFPSLYPPRGAATILAFTCLLQFTISVCIDSKYDNKLFGYLFWVIWYPVVYWVINSLTMIFTAPRVLFGKQKEQAVWKSPDRGLKKEEPPERGANRPSSVKKY